MTYTIMNINTLDEALTAAYYPMLSQRKQQAIVNLPTPKERSRVFVAEIAARKSLGALTHLPEDSFDIWLSLNKCCGVLGGSAKVCCVENGDWILAAASEDFVGADIFAVEPFQFEQVQKLLTPYEMRLVFANAGVTMAQAAVNGVCRDKRAMQKVSEILCAKKACFVCMGKQIDAPYADCEVKQNGELIYADRRYLTTLSTLSEDKQYIFTVVERMHD